MPIAQAMLIDTVDAAQLADVEALGLRARAVDTLMKTPEIARRVARAALGRALLTKTDYAAAARELELAEEPRSDSSMKSVTVGLMAVRARRIPPI